MIQENDMVVIREIKKSGCVAKVLDGGDRLMVRIPPSNEWPFPHHGFVDRGEGRKARKGKNFIRRSPI